LLDIEFALQGLVLAHAASCPALLNVTANAGLIEACRDAGLLDTAQANCFSRAHTELLRRALLCTLDLRSRIATRDAELETLCNDVSVVTHALGFAF
jgi:[glutamine synthetase] adenylyltransferase / [glutamine synthetase]-adenylyl-L-tyrosine phosphorylase